MTEPRCQKCGGVAITGHSICKACADQHWIDAFRAAMDVGKKMASMVMKQTQGPGEAVLSLIILAHSIHRMQPGLPSFDFYVKLVLDSAVYD